MHRSRSADPLKATRLSMAMTMPPVCIDMWEGRTDDELKLMLDTI
jgi:hypothetical protein